jgi:hypothetical protein
MIPMSAFQLRLPEMMMGIDEARGYYFAVAVYNFGIETTGDGFANFDNDSIFDEKVGVMQDLDIVIRIML